MEPTIETRQNQGTLKMMLKSTKRKKESLNVKKIPRNIWNYQYNTNMYFYHEIEAGKSYEGIGYDERQQDKINKEIDERKNYKATKTQKQIQLMLLYDLFESC